MRVFTDILLIITALGLWLALADWATGAPSTLLSYYFAKYDVSTSGVVIRSRIRGGGHGQKYDITYSYNVADTAYISDQINFLRNNSSTAIATMKKYPVDKSVTVRYDSAYPDFSVLEVTSLDGWVWFQFIAAIMMGLASASLLPLNLKRGLKTLF